MKLNPTGIRGSTITPAKDIKIRAIQRGGLVIGVFVVSDPRRRSASRAKNAVTLPNIRPTYKIFGLPVLSRYAENTPEATIPDKMKNIANKPPSALVYPYGTVMRGKVAPSAT